MVLCSLAIFTFIALLGNASTGISAFVGSFLGPIFVGKPAWLFIILSMVITIVLTNFMANMVVAVVMFAACLPIGATLGIDPMQLGFLYTICSSMAFLLPAASPAGMLVFMNKEWMTTGEIDKYAIPTIVMMAVVAYVWNIILFMFI
jgi:di/tricarboxylate transporter